MMLNSNPVFMALIFSWSSTASMPTGRSISKGGVLQPSVSKGGVLGLEAREEQGEGDCLRGSMGPNVQ
jgi:hypothetical protein